MPRRDGADAQGCFVEGLANFPFCDFEGFRTACVSGTASPFLAGQTACQWVEAGPHVSRWLKLETLALAFPPWLAFIAFVVYAVMRHPMLLLATPLLVIAYFLFHPATLRAFRIFAWVPLVVVLCLFGWAMLWGKPELAAVTGAALVIWYSQRLHEKKCANALFAAVREHEDLLCTLWSTRALGIWLKNGDILWADHKWQDGQTTLY